MPERILNIHPLAPLLLRDGRPFSASGGDETHARSLPLPLPSTLAGYVRTGIGQAAGQRWARASHADLEHLHSVPLYGPLLSRTRADTGAETLLFPAPRDAVMYRNQELNTLELMKLRPWLDLEGAGCDLPAGLLPLEPIADVKPESRYSYWTQADMQRWLLGETPDPNTLERIGELPLEKRTHVQIDRKTGAALEGMLYGVQYRGFESGARTQGSLEGPHFHYSLRARTKLEEGLTPEKVGHLGGERRPAALELRDDFPRGWWDCPEEMSAAFAALEGKTGAEARIKLTLATPALFEEGWKPGWIARSSEHSSPRGMQHDKVKLKLVGAALGRREAVSGWNLRMDRPKATRLMVPAGSTYFFEVQSGSALAVLGSWLRPVSDVEQDRKDGFGLALWGVW